MTRNDKDQISSAKTSTNSFKDSNFQEFHQPLSSNITVSARYSRENLEIKIVDFTQNGSKFELPFSKTLNSQQRFDLHSIAEKLGLVHESRGEGKDRYIVVSKPNPAPKG